MGLFHFDIHCTYGRRDYIKYDRISLLPCFDRTDDQIKMQANFICVGSSAWLETQNDRVLPLSF